MCRYLATDGKWHQYSESVEDDADPADIEAIAESVQSFYNESHVESGADDGNE